MQFISEMQNGSEVFGKVHTLLIIISFPLRKYLNEQEYGNVQEIFLKYLEHIFLLAHIPSKLNK